ncbi:hypothetical protein CROQUDRAFT_651894 [Cronartium quercuum f. sp. fusiforme G11]|uniref:Proteasome inhibitor PI31 subunit n=1 Tax=Cronartium quercuum f. sp. fusiforme G11 TaxID=708437 RepID=A0A9P6THE1_9BASI|nr:hypothetical protein CROQUDRAFT_651894 [Cronartium quercuum f. sp. fusiforme G11]
MTQIETDQDTQSSIMPNPPPDLTQLYQTIKRLIESGSVQSNQIHLELAAPLNTLAFLAHAILITHQFRLKDSNSSSVQQDIPPELTTDWEALKSSQRSIHANYAHPRSSLSFELSFGKLGDRISISGITVENDKVFTHDLSISGYFELAKFPIRLSKDEKDQGCLGFRSTSHLLDFMSLFINDILHHLLPDLVPKTSPQTIQPDHRPPPPGSAADTRQPVDLTPHAPPTLSPTHIASNQSPFNIGQSDLDPIGTSDLQIPSLYNRPSGGIGQVNTSNGMFVGPDHAIFDQHRLPNPARGPFGGDGFLPAGVAPPGARFDPIGPGPGFLPPGRGRGSGNGGFGMDPMGGLGQGLPMGHPFPGGSMGSQGRDFPGYDDMFL